MVNRTLTRDADIEVDGMSARYDVHKVDNGYTYTVKFGPRISDFVAARGFFGAPRKGTTVTAQAEVLVKASLAVVLARAEGEFVYVVIEDMPGFAQKRLGAHTQAGYTGGRAGGPRYVVRCDNHEQAEALTEQVREIGTIVDGSRSFSPKVTDVTNHALDALGGSLWAATDAITYIAAKRADEAVVHAIGG